MDLETLTGSFGRWQKRIFVVFFYVNVVGIWQNMSVTFLAPNMDFQCRNSTEKCFVDKNLTLPCTEWDYNTSFYSQTIVSEWDLVCDRAWLVSLAKSIYMIGFLLSVFIFGQLSDWFGRHFVIVVSYLITVISMFCSLLSPSYEVFVVLRFFQAFGRTALTTTGLVLMMEVVGEKHRTKIGVAIQLGWALGFSTLAGLAFIFKHWFWLQFAMSISLIPLAFAYWFIPESPRWLLIQGKEKKLESLLRKASKINRKETKFKIEDFRIISKQKSSKSVLDLFKTPQLRKITICMIYIWIVNAFMYYGLSYNTNDLAGNPYITFLVAGVLEFPSYAFLYWSLHLFGRRITLILLMVVAGLSCASMALVPESVPWAATTLAMVGKFCVTASFGLLYLYTSELFPTVVRNVAIGSCSMFARIGSIVAPFVKELGEATYLWLPSGLYGFLGVSSGLLTLLLPETQGQQMTDSLEEDEPSPKCPVQSEKAISVIQQQNTAM